MKCEIIGCESSSYGLKKWRQVFCIRHKCQRIMCPCVRPYKFFRFPYIEKDRKVWIEAVISSAAETCAPKPFVPKLSSRICSLHFVDRHPSPRHPYPELDLCQNSQDNMAIKYSDEVTENRVCCVPGCPVSDKYLSAMKRNKPKDSQLFEALQRLGFSALPNKSDFPDERQKWLQYIGSFDLKAGKFVEPIRSPVVCSLHFISDKPTQRNPYPMLKTPTISDTMKLSMKKASIGTVCYVAGCRSSDFETMFWEKEVCDQHDVPHASRDCRCEPPYVFLDFPDKVHFPNKYEKWMKIIMRFSDEGCGYAQPDDHEKICSKHFTRIDIEDPYPSKLIPKPCPVRSMPNMVSLLKKNTNIWRNLENDSSQVVLQTSGKIPNTRTTVLTNGNNVTYLINPAGCKQTSVMGKIVKTEGKIVHSDLEPDNLLLIKQSELKNLIATLMDTREEYHMAPAECHNYLGTIRTGGDYSAEESRGIVRSAGSLLCYVCGDSFTNRLQAVRHMKHHELGNTTIKCNICHKSVRTASLRKHKARHQKVKDHICPKCGVLVYRDDLYMHMQKHSDLKKYRCPNCEEAFKYASQRDAHMMDCHPNIVINYFDGKDSANVLKDLDSIVRTDSCYLDEHNGMNYSVVKDGCGASEQAEDMEDVSGFEGSSCEIDYVLVNQGDEQKDPQKDPQIQNTALEEDLSTSDDTDDGDYDEEDFYQFDDVEMTDSVPNEQSGNS